MNLNVENAVKKGILKIVSDYTGVTMEDVLGHHVKVASNHTLVSDRKVTVEMLAEINAEIKVMLAAIERKFRTKLAITFLAEQGANDETFVISEKVLN